MYLIGNGSLLTRDRAHPFFQDGAVLIEGETIKETGTEKELRKKYPQADYINAHGGIIMPGLINAHTHIYSALARGLSIAGNNPRNFLEILEGTWWNIDRHLSLEMTRASAWATIMDSIRNGVTTIFDHHASFLEIEGFLFAIRDAAKQAGIRACLCYEVSERDGMEKCDAAIAENAAFARWAKEADDGMIRAMFGGHALFTISDATFEKMVRANDGMTGFHIHVAEGMNDVYDSLRNYGYRPVNRLLYNGILGEKTLLGHCIHISPAEMDIIKETGTMAVNNPESNMGNAVGCAPVIEMMKRGIVVGLGTDAYTADMLESQKAFLTIQRHNACMPNVGWNEAVSTLFENNAKIAAKYFGKEVGVLKKGAAADVIIADYHPYTPFSEENADGHILFGMSGRDVRTTIINGTVVYLDRQFTKIEEEAMYAEIKEQAKCLWGELNHRKY